LQRIGTPFFPRTRKSQRNGPEEAFTGSFSVRQVLHAEKVSGDVAPCLTPFCISGTISGHFVATVADSKKINHAASWRRTTDHARRLWLKQLGLTFELNGGTSLSKGFGIIQRFSFEDEKIRKQF